MNYEELIDFKNEKKEFLRSLITNCKNENRKLTEDEDKQFNEIKEELRNIEKELINIEQIKNKPIKTIKTMERNLSIVGLINEELNKRSYSEESKQLLKEGEEIMKRGGQSYEGIAIPMNYRATIDVATNGSSTVETQILDLVTPLRDKLILTAAGAQMLTGLVGNVSLPKYSGSSALWKGETETAGDGAGTFSEVELSPKRLTTSISVSKQFLMQNAVDAENMLRNDIINAIAEKLQKTILGGAAHAATVPDGLFTGLTLTPEAVEWADIVGMESEIESANALGGNLSYIVAPSVKAKMKVTPKATGISSFIQEGNEVNGYPVYSTNSIITNGAVFGNWNDLVIAQWGALDIVVDPFTSAKEAKVNLVINAYFDIATRRSQSFSKKLFN